MLNSNNVTVTRWSPIRAPRIFVLFEGCHTLSILRQSSPCWLYLWDLYIIFFKSTFVHRYYCFTIFDVLIYLRQMLLPLGFVYFWVSQGFFICYLQFFNAYQIALLLTPNLSAHSYWYKLGLDSRSCVNCAISIFKHGLFLCTFGYRLLVQLNTSLLLTPNFLDIWSKLNSFFSCMDRTFFLKSIEHVINIVYSKLMLPSSTGKISSLKLILKHKSDLYTLAKYKECKGSTREKLRSNCDFKISSWWGRNYKSSE